MADRQVSRKPPETFTAAFLRLIWGRYWAPWIVAGVVVLSGIGSVWIVVRPKDKSKPELRPEPSWISYRPIENVKKLMSSFEVPNNEPRIELRFISPTFDIDFRFPVHQGLEVNGLKDALLGHFGIEAHVSLDLSGFPSGDGCHFIPWFTLLANGRQITDFQIFETRSKTLAEVGVRDGDIIRLKITWIVQMPVSMPTRSSPNDGNDESSAIDRGPHDFEL